jgi:hypothetical protein
MDFGMTKILVEYLRVKPKRIGRWTINLLEDYDTLCNANYMSIIANS